MTSGLLTVGKWAGCAGFLPIGMHLGVQYSVLAVQHELDNVGVRGNGAIGGVGESEVESDDADACGSLSTQSSLARWSPLADISPLCIIHTAPLFTNSHPPSPSRRFFSSVPHSAPNLSPVHHTVHV